MHNAAGAPLQDGPFSTGGAPEDDLVIPQSSVLILVEVSMYLSISVYIYISVYIHSIHTYIHADKDRIDT